MRLRPYDTTKPALNCFPIRFVKWSSPIIPAKNPEKDALEEAYWQVTDEQERRQKVQMEAAIVETEARKKIYEQLGAVWYTFSGASTRHTVSAVTEKTIAFKGWHFIDGRWETCPSFDMRVKKELLGFSPKTAKTTGKKNAMMPVGTLDLAGQKPEVSETVVYQ